MNDGKWNNYVLCWKYCELYTFRGQRWILLTYRNTCGQDILSIHNQHKKKTTKQRLHWIRKIVNLIWIEHIVNSLRHPIYWKFKATYECALHNAQMETRKISLSQITFLHICPIENQIVQCAVICDSKIRYKTVHFAHKDKTVQQKTHRQSDVHMN